MGIMEEINVRQTQTQLVTDYLATLTKKERDEWAHVFSESGKFTNAAISRALQARGLAVNEYGVYRYRKTLGGK